MIPHTSFTCPHCGAPGQVNYGAAEYSCTCRFKPFISPGCPHCRAGDPFYDKTRTEHLIRDEAGIGVTACLAVKPAGEQ